MFAINIISFLQPPPKVSIQTPHFKKHISLPQPQEKEAKIQIPHLQAEIKIKVSQKKVKVSIPFQENGEVSQS